LKLGKPEFQWNQVPYIFFFGETYSSHGTLGTGASDGWLLPLPCLCLVGSWSTGMDGMDMGQNMSKPWQNQSCVGEGARKIKTQTN